jgi:hypothetical protein
MLMLINERLSVTITAGDIAVRFLWYCCNLTSLGAIILSVSSEDVSSWLLAQIDGETVFSANLIQLCWYGGWPASSNGALAVRQNS